MVQGMFFRGLFGVQGSILSRVQEEYISGVSEVHIIWGLYGAYEGFRGGCIFWDFEGCIWSFLTRPTSVI